MRKFVVLLLLFCCAMGMTPQASAQEKLWAGILLATNQHAASAQTLPSALKPYRERIARFFGYRFFKVLGERTMPLNGANRHLSVSTKHLSLNVDSTTISASKLHKNYQLQFKLYEGKKLLVRASAKVSKGSPLLIRGPLCGHGQALIVLLVK